MICQHVGHWANIDGKTIRCNHCGYEMDLSTKLTPLERALITLAVAFAGLLIVVNSYDIAIWIRGML